MEWESIRFKNFVTSIYESEKNISRKLTLSGKHYVWGAIILVVIIVCIIGLLFYRGYREETLKISELTTPIYKYFNVSVSGRLENGVIAPDIILPTSKKYLVVYPAGIVEKIKGSCRANLRISELLIFQQDKRPLYLGHSETPTVFEVNPGVKIKVRLNYPSWSTNFLTFKKGQNAYVPGTIKIKYQLTDTLPKDYVEPADFERLKGPLGTYFPNIKVHNKSPGLDINAESKKRPAEDSFLIPMINQMKKDYQKLSGKSEKT